MQFAFDFSTTAEADSRKAVRPPEPLPLEPEQPTPVPTGVVQRVDDPIILPVRGRPPRGRSKLLKRIQRVLTTETDLIVTDNRRTMISTRRRDGRLEVRLHHMFLDAPDEIIEELLSYLAEGDVCASRRIGRYIEDNRYRIKERSRRVLLRARGSHHDLLELYDEVAEEHFGPIEGEVQITWGRLPPRKKRRRRRSSIRLGTYTHDAQLIRIHPALDQSWVPQFFVAFVVFHELLHHVVPGRQIGSRLDHHPPEFKEVERAHPDYRRALSWEAENLDALLRF